MLEVLAAISRSEDLAGEEAETVAEEADSLRTGEGPSRSTWSSICTTLWRLDKVTSDWRCLL